MVQLKRAATVPAAFRRAVDAAALRSRLRGQGPSGGSRTQPSSVNSAARMSRSGARLRVYDDLFAVEREWKRLEISAEGTAFQSFDWLAAFIQHVAPSRDIKQAIVCGWDLDGELLFVFPFAIEKKGPIRSLVWLGSDLCDYNAPIFSSESLTKFCADNFDLLWAEVIALLRSDPRYRFDLIDLQKMPDCINGVKNPFVALPVFPHTSSGHLVELGTTWDSFYAAKRSSSTRKRERRQLRQMSDHGEVRFVRMREPAEIETTLETLFRQKSAWFARTGVANIFARPGYRDFFRELATDRGMQDMVHLHRLDIGRAIAATSFGLLWGTRFYLVLSSYTDGDLARFGPGRAHLHELFRFAIENGCTELDLTIGDEPYKFEWSDRQVRLFDHLCAATIRGGPMVVTMKALRQAKGVVKTTPALWSAFVRARALLGSTRTGR